MWTTAHQHLVADGSPTTANGRQAAADLWSSVALLGASWAEDAPPLTRRVLRSHDHVREPSFHSRTL